VLRPLCPDLVVASREVRVVEFEQGTHVPHGVRKVQAAGVLIVVLAVEDVVEMAEHAIPVLVVWLVAKTPVTIVVLDGSHLLDASNRLGHPREASHEVGHHGLVAVESKCFCHYNSSLITLLPDLEYGVPGLASGLNVRFPMMTWLAFE
jgi:hypothetical protein